MALPVAALASAPIVLMFQVRAVLRFSWQDIFLRPDLFLREVEEKLVQLA